MPIWLLKLKSFRTPWEALQSYIPASELEQHPTYDEDQSEITKLRQLALPVCHQHPGLLFPGIYGVVVLCDQAIQLKGEPPRNRLIFSATAGQVDPEKSKPPFYQFGVIGVVACERWYEFYTRRNLLATGPVEGHTSPCGQEDGLASDTLRTGLLDHLKESNFNVATLPEDIYETMPYGRITHAQASICILKKIHGLSFVAPAAEGVFQDVPSVDPYAAWMEQLFREGLIDACSDVQVEICPGNEFTLEDAAKLILRLKNGTMYIPSATVQSLNHSCSSPASPWVEEFQNQGFLAGCTEDAFNCCPEKTVDILQLAGFLSRVLKGS